MGGDIDPPSLTGAGYQGTFINDCKANAPGFDSNKAILGFSDDCAASVTASLTGTSDTGDDCNWTVTYNYTVSDGCTTTTGSYTEMGGDIDPPSLTGTGYQGTFINDCQVNAPGFNPGKALMGYTDDCAIILTATGTTSMITGDDCNWTVTYNYTVSDGCTTTTGSYTDFGGNTNMPVIPLAQQQADFTGANVLFTVPTDCNRNAAIQIPVINDACGNAIPQTAASGTSTPGWTITSDDPNLSFIDNGNFWDGDFQVGITNVTITGTDICGNMVTDQIMVEVIDNIPPVLVTGNGTIPCPPNQTIFADSMSCAADFTWTDPGVLDNCILTNTDISFSNGMPSIANPFPYQGGGMRTVTFALGMTTVTYTAFDNSNNSAVVCSFTIDVNDAVDPIANCPAIPDVQLDANGNGTLAANIGMGLSSDNCSSLIETSPLVTLNCTDIVSGGSVTLTATDTDGNVGTASCSFNVVDLLPPTAQCQNISVMLDSTGMATIVASAINNGSIDNCDGKILSDSLSASTFDCSDIGPNSVTLTVTDGSNNSSTCMATVTIADGINPIAVCPPMPTISLDQVTGTIIIPANLGTGQSTDNCSVISELNTTPTFDCSDIGVNTYDLTATDNSGNTNTITCNVQIVDSSAPIFICPTPIIDFSTQSDCNVTIRATIPGITDNCDAISTLSFNNGGLPIQTDALGNPITPVTISNLSIVNSNTEWQAEFPLGITYLSISATDVAGNTNACTFSVTVEDNFDPDAICNPLTVVLDGNGMGSIDVNDFTSGDNCGVASVSLSPSTFTCSDLGAPVNATFTVIDDDNNINSCVSVVTVLDNEDPVITLIGNPFEFPNCSSSTYNDLGVTISDNCDMNLSPTVTGGPVDLSTAGTYTLTYTATDASGNSASVSRTIIVNDPLGGFTLVGITGEAFVCAGKNGFSYSIPPTPGAATITWSHSLGTAQFVAGQGSSGVLVNFPDDLSLEDGYCITDGAGTPGGTIDVTITGGCSPMTMSLPITYLDDEVCSVYNCFVDLHINDALALPAADSPTLYVADQRISSDGTVLSDRTVDYFAGQSVELKQGFEVKKNAVFLADIAPCVSQQFFTSAQADLLIESLKEDGINLDRESLKILEDN